ncbi:hypothetical protein PROFUN_10754 [Planoprotostelium fungivorum]|uniref:Uncharacterized protein n=1 Tax=Planoprotostelium fungivorum TaxID=1890364 RepID=A0A2P6N802_9EUKA|nr:hypothetical protein PROFUN_10754 [Planoprotostelium fungivorum]
MRTAMIIRHTVAMEAFGSLIFCHAYSSDRFILNSPNSGSRTIPELVVLIFGSKFHTGRRITSLSNNMIQNFFGRNRRMNTSMVYRTQNHRLTQDLIHGEQQYDDETWRHKCLRDFHHEAGRNHNRKYSEVYRDLLDWKRMVESFTVSKSGGGLSLFDQFGTGVSLHGEPLIYTWPHHWDGSLVRYCVNGSGSYEERERLTTRCCGRMGWITLSSSAPLVSIGHKTMIRRGGRPLVLAAVPRTVPYSRGVIGFSDKSAPFYWSNQNHFILDGQGAYKDESIDPFFLAIRLNQRIQEKAYVRPGGIYWGAWDSWVQHTLITAVQGDEADDFATKEELKMVKRMQEISRERVERGETLDPDGDEAQMLRWESDWNSFLVNIGPKTEDK